MSGLGQTSPSSPRWLLGLLTVVLKAILIALQSVYNTKLQCLDICVKWNQNHFPRNSSTLSTDEHRAHLQANGQTSVQTQILASSAVLIGLYQPCSAQGASETYRVICNGHAPRTLQEVISNSLLLNSFQKPQGWGSHKSHQEGL